MAVIIRDMEMPKSCADCSIFYDMICCPITETQADWTNMNAERLHNCPLEPVNDKENQNEC